MNFVGYEAMMLALEASGVIGLRLMKIAHGGVDAGHEVILMVQEKVEAAAGARAIIGKLKLTVNEEKTRICTVPGGEFDFLGYTFGRMFSARTGEARIGYRPSKKSIERVVEKVHALTDRAGTWQETTCGAAGRAYAMLDLYRHTGDGLWVDRARGLADRAATLIREWSMHRDSLYKGEIGVALLAADLDEPARSCMPLFDKEP